MGLGSLLKSAGSLAVRIHTDAEVTIRLVDGSSTSPDRSGDGLAVPGVDVTFAAHALNEANCGSSRVLATVPEVNLVASLERL
jgi:hypothetical protein